MRVLVTGGAGFVGSHVVETLLSRGHAVDVIDDLSTGHRDWVPQGVEFIEADLAHGYNLEVFVETIKPDAICHLAAYADLRSNWKDASERRRLYEANVDVTRRLLEAMERPVPVVFASTASVYGAARYDAPVREYEATPETIQSPYAASKFACEAMIAAYAHAKRFPWYALRLVNVVGARSTHGVIGDFARMAKETGRIHAADDGRQRKSWVHVADVADVFARLATAVPAARIPSGVYSVTSEQRVSWRDIVREMGIDDSMVTCEARPGGAIGDPINLNVSGVKLGIYMKPRRNVLEGVREALAFLGWGESGMKIIVNGIEHRVTEESLSYEVVVRIAKMSGKPSVTYRRAAGDRDGILSPGRAVHPKEGTVFYVAHTGAS